MPNIYVTWACGHQAPTGFNPEKGWHASKPAAEEYARTHVCPDCYRRLQFQLGKRQAGRERDRILKESTP